MVRTNLTKDTSIVSLEHHSMGLTEAACLVRESIFGPSQPKLYPAWTMLDRFDYGYYMDFINWGLNFWIVNNQIKPDFLLLDITYKSFVQSYFNDYPEQKKRVIIQENPIYILDLR